MYTVALTKRLIWTFKTDPFKSQRVIQEMFLKCLAYHSNKREDMCQKHLRKRRGMIRWFNAELYTYKHIHTNSLANTKIWCHSNRRIQNQEHITLDKSINQFLHVLLWGLSQNLPTKRASSSKKLNHNSRPPGQHFRFTWDKKSTWERSLYNHGCLDS